MQTACERSRNESNLSITAPGYILLLLKSNIQFHHECYRTIAALLAQQVVHHKLESDSLCHFHAEVIAYMFVKEMANSLGFENTAFFTQFFKRFTGSTPQEYRKH